MILNGHTRVEDPEITMFPTFQSALDEKKKNDEDVCMY